jgi:hypothetical protein
MNTTPPAEGMLPPIGDDRVDAMETAVFARIAEERGRRRSRRGRLWLGGAAAAAVVIVAAVIAPAVTSHVTIGGSAGSSAADGTEAAPYPAEGLRIEGQEAGGAGGAIAEGAAGTEAAPGAAVDQSSEAATDTTREIATTASATVVVGDVADAAEEIGEDAEARGGYVESVNVDARTASVAPAEGAPDSLVAPYPYPAGGGWITVRVPSTELDDTLDALEQVGEVTTSNVGRQDVTDQAVDLRARVSASEASVARLTELIAQAESVGDLIAAESALSERQATLESDRQQLEWLENQVALSTLTVQLTPETPAVEADPAGFGDGVVAGWNGLVATLNGIVIAIGFLLPWIAVLAVIAAVVWGIVSLVKRARSRPREARAVEPEAQRE